MRSHKQINHFARNIISTQVEMENQGKKSQRVYY